MVTWEVLIPICQLVRHLLLQVYTLDSADQVEGDSGIGSNLENRSYSTVFWGGSSQHQMRHVLFRAFCCHCKFLIPINEFQASNLYQWNQWNQRNIRWSRWSLGTSSILAARALRQRPATPGVGHQTQKSNQKSQNSLRSLLKTFGSAKISHLLDFTTLRWSVFFLYSFSFI